MRIVCHAVDDDIGPKDDRDWTVDRVAANEDDRDSNWSETSETPTREEPSEHDCNR